MTFSGVSILENKSSSKVFLYYRKKLIKIKIKINLVSIIRFNMPEFNNLKKKI